MNARRTKQTDQDNGANAMNMMTKIRGGAPTVISALGPACADWASVVDEYRGRRVDRESFADTFNAAEKAYFANKTESNEAKRRTSETAYKAASNKALVAYEQLAETPVSNLEQFLQKLEIIADEEDAFHECNSFIGWLITIAKNDAMSLSRSYGTMALAPVAALPAVASTPDRSEWREIVARFKIADAAANDVATRFEAATSAFNSMRLPEPETVVRINEAQAKFERGHCETLVRQCRESGQTRDSNEVARQAFDAMDEYKRIDRENDNIRRSLQIPSIEREWDDACDTLWDAKMSLKDCPAPDMAATMEKLQLLIDLVDGDELSCAVLKDLARLNGGTA